jgi:hypothetical protein
VGVPASADPARAADDAAEVAANELGILVCKYVSLDLPESGLGLLVATPLPRRAVPGVRPACQRGANVIHIWADEW